MNKVSKKKRLQISFEKIPIMEHVWLNHFGYEIDYTSLPEWWSDEEKKLFDSINSAMDLLEEKFYEIIETPKK